MTFDKAELSRDAGEHGESGIVREAVARSQRGDMEALHFLYVRYAPDVFTCVQGLMHNDDEAEEVTRDVFKSLTTLIVGFQRESEPFASWLLGVAHAAAQEQADRDRLQTSSP